MALPYLSVPPPFTLTTPLFLFLPADPRHPHPSPGPFGVTLWVRGSLEGKDTPTEWNYDVEDNTEIWETATEGVRRYPDLD